MNAKYIYIIVSILLLTNSCTSKFDDYNTNDDAATKVTPAMLSTYLILDITQIGGAKYSLYHKMLDKSIAWSEGSAESYQYNDLGRISFNSIYANFTNCEKMIQAAGTSPEGIQNSYKGLYKFVKAYQLFNLSMQVGDIPYSDSNKGEEGNIKPKYDTQKKVMTQILNDLDEAEQLFSIGTDFGGDPILKGSPSKWRKIIKAFQLKVLVNLSKKENDADLRIKERFSSIAASTYLMSSNNDNFQLTYSDIAGQQYPLYHNDHVQYLMISNTLVDPLKKYNDYRLFYYATPAEYQLKAGYKADDYEAYIGIDPSAVQSENNVLHGEGKFSGPNERYLRPEGEPIMRISYMEQNFILAEGALRGWLNKEKADEYYKKGIRASMEFIAKYTPNKSEYHHNRPIEDNYISQYLIQPSIQLNGDFNHDLELILLQKYLASYLQHPNYDSFYDNRRTGYPKLPINPNSNLNTDRNRLPIRWLYPQAELDYNKENIEEAIKRQYNGNDDTNQTMWMIQE